MIEKKFNIIIVDDEQDIRERLASIIKERNDLFNIVASFENGADALEGIINLKPDILVTDIKIPYIEGMELISEALKFVPYLKSIVITGFDVFEYAKRAVELEVVGFLTKPITALKLNENLDKAVNKINEEIANLKNKEVIDELKLENNVLIKESLFNKLLREDNPKPWFINRLANNDINLDFKNFQVIIVNVHDYQKDLEIETYLIQFYQELANNITYICSDFTIKNEQLVVLLKANEDINVEKQLQKIISKHLRYQNNNISVGISLPFSNFEFKKHYDQAKEALTYRSLIANDDNVYRYLEKPTNLDFSFDIELTRELRYSLEYLDYESSKEILDKLISQSFLSNNQIIHYIVISNILNEIFKSVMNMNKLIESLGNINDYYLQFLNMHSQTKILEKFDFLLKTISDINKNERSNLSKNNTNKIIRLIENNYKNSNYNLDLLAEEVNLSLSYISLLLKEENTSFVKYLTSLRIKESERLLINSDMKIVEIAEEVGYLDPYYFSHAFKKHTGLSPRKYRSEYENIKK